MACACLIGMIAKTADWRPARRVHLRARPHPVADGTGRDRVCKNLEIFSARTVRPGL